MCTQRFRPRRARCLVLHGRAALRAAGVGFASELHQLRPPAIRVKPWMRRGLLSGRGLWSERGWREGEGGGVWGMTECAPLFPRDAAAAAQLDKPLSVAVGAAGDVYVGCFGAVRRVAPGGGVIIVRMLPGAKLP
eukprot:gene3811-1341_t